MLGLVVGATIGVLSGLTGTGGAIFLTPLLLFAHWMPTREASGTSVAFVWINSLTGLAGLLHATGTLAARVAGVAGRGRGRRVARHPARIAWLPVRGCGVRWASCC